MCFVKRAFHTKVGTFAQSVAAGPKRVTHNSAGEAISPAADRETVFLSFATSGEPMQSRASTNITETAGKTPNFLNEETLASQLQICLC